MRAGILAQITATGRAADSMQKTMHSTPRKAWAELLLCMRTRDTDVIVPIFMDVPPCCYTSWFDFFQKSKVESRQKHTHLCTRNAGKPGRNRKIVVGVVEACNISYSHCHEEPHLVNFARGSPEARTTTNAEALRPLLSKVPPREPKTPQLRKKP